MFKLKQFNLMLILLLCILIIFDFSFAVDTSSIQDEFASADSSNLSLEKIRNTLFTILTYIGYASAVLVTLATGIGFITATPAKKAKLKEKLWLIVIGIVLLAGGIPAVQAIADIFDSIRNTL